MRMVPASLVWLVLGAACSEESVATCPAPDPARWVEKEPSSYVFRTCGTGFIPGACTIVVVEDGVVVATHDADETDEFGPVAPSDANTLSDDFGTRDCSECEVLVSQDSSWGYVNSTYTDCGSEGWGSEVECFAPNTVDPDACR